MKHVDHAKRGDQKTEILEVTLSGSKEGAYKAVQTKREKYGPNFMKEVGSRGGKARNKSKKKYIPFKENPGLASLAGKIGSSRRWIRDKKLDKSSVVDDSSIEEEK